MSQKHLGCTQPKNKTKKKSKKEQRPCHNDQLLSAAIHKSPPNATLENHKKSPEATFSKRKQCTSNVIAQSKIIGFHPGERPSSQNNTFNKAIAMHNQ